MRPKPMRPKPMRPNAARPAPRGRFRSYLLACAKHYAANERDRGRALKRGGGRQQLPFDIVMREDDAGHSLEPSDTRSPEQAYTRAWVRQATEQALARLEAQEETKGRAAAFELLRPALEGEGQDYAGIAATLGSSEGAIKVAAHRLRKRYRELLLEELGATVETAAEAEIELAELLADLE
jgi:DNA-directed RNA polymerase specialized sigma24 family protein